MNDVDQITRLVMQRNVNIRKLHFSGAPGRVSYEIFEAVTEDGGQNNGAVSEVHNWMRWMDQPSLERAFGNWFTHTQVTRASTWFWSEASKHHTL